MKLVSSGSLFSIALCASLAIVDARERQLPHMELRMKPKAQNLRRGSSFLDDYGAQADGQATQVVVRYQNEQAKLNALEAAEAVVEESENDNVVVLKMRQDRYEALKRTERLQIDIDNKVEAFTHIHVEQLPFASRNLAEEIPWGIKTIQADQLDVGQHDVTVCIIDTGFAQGHPDLPTSTTGTSTPQRDFIWNEDLNGHGTHVAGVLAAIGGNNLGVTGAGNIKLHIARALDQYSSGYETDVTRAVSQCVDAGAKVISISLGSAIMSNPAKELYTKTVEQDGVMIVAAAGNLGHTGESHHAYPASHPSVVSVGAVYPWESRWAGSNFCDQVELAAPGHRVLSTSVSTSVVHTSDFSHPGERVSQAPNNDVAGTLVDCGSGDTKCSLASGSICVLTRDETDLNSMLENCEDGGGIGAIIFNADESNAQDWRGNSNIPAVGVEHEAGVDILAKVGTVVRLGFSNADDEREFSYRYLSGTSMATPHVAAAAALVWSHFPQCSNHQIRQALAVTAQAKGVDGCDWEYGYGIVKAKDAYDYLLANDCTQGDWWQPVGQDDHTPVCEWSFPLSAAQDDRQPDPSPSPTKRPTSKPTASPTKKPTLSPTVSPTAYPTKRPKAPPTTRPTFSPTTPPPTLPTTGDDSSNNANTVTIAVQSFPTSSSGRLYSFHSMYGGSIVSLFFVASTTVVWML